MVQKFVAQQLMYVDVNSIPSIYHRVFYIFQMKCRISELINSITMHGLFTYIR